MASEGDEVTTNLTFGPPRYQATLPSQARKILECEGETIRCEAKLTIKRVESEEDNTS
jgi:hypothetical protein